MSRQERKQFLLENLIYLIVWLVIFADPLLRTTSQSERQWEIITGQWRMALPFFVLFLINNYLLVPYFLIRRKSWRYALFAFVCFLLFACEPFVTRSFSPSMAERFNEQRFLPPRGERFSQPQPERGPRMREPDALRPFPNLGERSAFMLNRFVINRLLIAILMLGFNVAIKFLFKSIRDDRRLRELEKHTLETELNYLKIQISPHFFMNTLNNIHALIDMDAEKAKDTIIGLSKIMRYVLYDADRPHVALSQEVQFILNYVSLMRIRYTEEIDIRLKLPAEIPDAKIPPLLFFTLIENAFKHGISYRRESFIHIILSIEAGRLHCLVANTKHPRHAQDKLGVGMENMRKRLELLYGGAYTLDILQGGDETYQISLNIPLEA
jgi:two-component sensor histidine kinase